jgi:membrane protease YdiL (CAAX protease family)
MCYPCLHVQEKHEKDLNIHDYQILTMKSGEKMNDKESIEFPTPKACILVFIVTFALSATIGSVLQMYAVLPGLYITEWLFILGPPLLFLWMKKVNIKETLKLHQFHVSHLLLGIVGGVGTFFIAIATAFLMEDILGPYPGADYLQEVFPTTWLGFIPWILAFAFSAGICEEILFRGFIQNGLHTHWGPAKALIVATILFTVAHMDPWRTPAVILLGLMAGYLLIRTGFLYSAIAVHMTANTISNVLSFTETFPESTDQWLLVLTVSFLLVLVVLIVMERGRKKG